MATAVDARVAVLTAPGDGAALSRYLCEDGVDAAARAARWFHRYLRLVRRPDSVALRLALLSAARLDVASIVATASPDVDSECNGLVGAVLHLVDPSPTDPARDAYLIDAPVAERIRVAVKPGVAAWNLKSADQIIRLRRAALGPLHRAGLIDTTVSFTLKTASFLTRVRRGAYGGRERYLSPSWSAHIGHLVMLAHLAHGARHGLIEGGRLKLWDVRYGNRPLFDKIARQIGGIDLVPERTGMPEDHLSSLPEFVGGRFMNHFDAFEQVLALRPPPAGHLLVPEEEDRALVTALLAEAGLPADRPLVTVHVRDTPLDLEPNGLIRNSDIATLVPALRSLAAAGYTIIRLGNPKMPALPAIAGVFDYAHSPWKSAALDTALAALSRFHIGGSSGMSLVSMLFGVPTLFLDWYPLHLIPHGARHHVVLKRLVDRASGADLTSAEEYRRLGGMIDLDVLAHLGANLVNLTADQITTAVDSFAADVEAGAADRPAHGEPRMFAPSGESALIEVKRSDLRIL